MCDLFDLVGISANRSQHTVFFVKNKPVRTKVENICSNEFSVVISRSSAVHTVEQIRAINILGIRIQFRATENIMEGQTLITMLTWDDSI